MMFKLILTAVVLLRPAMGIFELPKKFFPSKFLVPHKPVKVDVHKLQKTVDAIQSNQGQILDNIEAIFKTQQGFNVAIGVLLGQQGGTSKALKGVAATASATLDNTGAILQNQKAILKGQKNIRAVVNAEHDATRKVIKKTASSLNGQLDKVAGTQNTILRSLDKFFSFIAHSFDKAQAAEVVTRSLVASARKAVATTAAANAQGQAKIKAEVAASQKVVQAVIAKILGGQNAIFKKIASIRASEEKKLDAVLGRQGDILAQIAASQKAVRTDVREAIGLQRDTQKLVVISQKVVQRDLQKQSTDQTTTQHLAKKCVIASKCDLSGVIHALKALRGKQDSMGTSVTKGLREVRKRQGVTQGKVTSSEKNIVETLNKDFDQIDQVIKAIGNFVDAKKGKIQQQVKVIEQSIKETKSSQISTLKLIAKIHLKIDDLLKVH